jgi:glutamate-1-semialdehyde aminotransferase
MNNIKYSLEDLKSSKGVSLYNTAKTLIPGGTQLLSKRPEMFAPNVWPSYYKKAKGYKIWDLDDREFNDLSIMSVGACIIGYQDDEIDEAVIRAIKDGVNSTLNCPEEVELANELISLHPWFGMVRYARSGGEAMSIAIRISRAHSQRDLVLFSGYHGWNDWYLAANLSDLESLDGQLMPGLSPSGVPRGLNGSALPFDANNIDSIREKIKGKEKDIACIVIEPARGEDAPEGYLQSLRELADEIGAVLIFDEITSGFRMCAGGIHRKYAIYPDIAVLAKSIANGYAMSVIMGKEKIMQSAQSTFISSTNWTERVGPTAALATIKKYIRTNTDQHIITVGNEVKKIWENAANSNNLNIIISGLPSLANFRFDYENSTELNTIFSIEMLKRGFLGFRQIKTSLCHDSKILEEYKKVVQEIFSLISMQSENVKLKTPIHHSGFQRITKE